MKIYQIHETGGEWEDSYDLIAGSYLSPRKAEIECQKLRVEEDKRIVKARKCYDCPLYDSWNPITEQVVEAAKRYCPYYVRAIDKHCSNYEGDTYERHFDVQEEEVIE